MKIGDKVSVIDDNIDGIITNLSEDTITIMTEEGFELQFAEKELIVISDDKQLNDLVQVSDEEINSKREFLKKSPKINKKKKQLPPMEVDLHIHHLVPDCTRLESHEKLTIQLETVKKRLDFAIKKKIQRIVFIHGVGEGVLREELQYLLRRYDNLEFYDADFQKYGVGATEVYIYQNKKP
jgi:dsDNA-specific endonuclease/ATPase MutS2